MAGIQNERLTAFIQRVERLEEEAAGLRGDIKEIYAEAKSAGYDTKVMRILIRERKMDRADLQEQQALLEVYREALGGFRDTALGKAGEKFVAGIPADSSVTISAGDTEVTIAKDKAGNVIRTGNLEKDVGNIIADVMPEGATLQKRDGTVLTKADGKVIRRGALS